MPEWRDRGGPPEGLVAFHDGLIRHDWVPDQGTAESVCTGCNFFTLSNVWTYEHLKE